MTEQSQDKKEKQDTTISLFSIDGGLGNGLIVLILFILLMSLLRSQKRERKLLALVGDLREKLARLTDE